MTFGSAQEFCRSRNGDLASINSLIEEQTVSTLISGTHEYVWIGYIDDRDTGINWKFIDGKGGYTNWDDSQPKLGNGMCGVIYAANGKWHTADCDLHHFPLCRTVSYRSNNQFAC